MSETASGMTSRQAKIRIEPSTRGRSSPFGWVPEKSPGRPAWLLVIFGGTDRSPTGPKLRQLLRGKGESGPHPKRGDLLGHSPLTWFTFRFPRRGVWLFGFQRAASEFTPGVPTFSVGWPPVRGNFLLVLCSCGAGLKSRPPLGALRLSFGATAVFLAWGLRLSFGAPSLSSPLV